MSLDTLFDKSENSILTSEERKFIDVSYSREGTDRKDIPLYNRLGRMRTEEEYHAWITEGLKARLPIRPLPNQGPQQSSLYARARDYFKKIYTAIFK